MGMGEEGMSFDRAYAEFMQAHLEAGKGERLRRLTEGHGHAEKASLERVWWPAVGSFEWLHPEYEEADFKDGFRYLDFAYIRFPYRISIEIDGYGPHHRDISRAQFADQLMRQNHLVIDGWRIIRFSYDDIAEKSRRCQQTIQQWMGMWFGGDRQRAILNGSEHKLVNMAISRQSPITPEGAGEYLGISTRQARTLLHRLVSAKVMVPESGSKRIRSYKLNPDGKHLFL